MLVHHLVENVCATAVSASLASHNVTGWQINKGFGTATNTFPCVKIVCRSFEPMYKELNLGTGKAHLEIETCAIKAVGDAGQGTAATTFETVSDYVFNPFVANNAAATLTTGSLQVLSISDDGLDVVTASDGWIATQKLEIVCARTS